jgi:hypothetical protein
MHDKSDEKDGSTRRSFLKGAATAAVGASALAVPAGCASGRAETLEVLNPRAKPDIRDFCGLSVPRLDTLDGKRIVIFREKPDDDVFLKPLQAQLLATYPTATVDYVQGTANLASADADAEVLRNYDAFIAGMRHTGGTDTEPAVAYERSGKPGLLVCLDTTIEQARRSAMVHGMPTVRMVAVNAERWCAAGNNPKTFVPIVADYFDVIVHALTDPLTAEEQHPKPFEYDFANLRFEGADYSDAFCKFQDYFLEHGLSDGIAVAPPTPEAVAKMLTGTSRKPDEVIPGVMQPGRGIVTIEKIAVNAVMAGAKPEYLPVIITAVEMLCDPDFYSYHLLAAINGDSLLVNVGGPVAKELGISGQMGCFGPGNRANNSIGRAISLCALNCGWINYKFDGGMYGEASRFCNLVFAENSELSPWEPYAVSQGFSPQDSTVMIEEIFYIDGVFQLGDQAMPSGIWTYGFDADLEKITQRARGDAPTLEQVAKGVVNPFLHALQATDPAQLMRRNYILILYPGQARQLAAAGFTREKLLDHIRDYHRLPWDKLPANLQKGVRKLAESGTMRGLSVSDCQSGGTVPVISTDGIAIFVAGSMSGQTLGMYPMGSYGSGTLRQNNGVNTYYYIKKITGATLTEAGK